jgi:hypothetical protein
MNIKNKENKGLENIKDLFYSGEGNRGRQEKIELIKV